MLILIGLWSSVNCFGDHFIDDWISQKVVTNPSSFESQKRNFYSGGGVSLRWDQSKDYLVSITKPGYSRGCGGIDAFLGGISFLDADYLVEKLNKIMHQYGATFAFNLALATIAEPIEDQITKLEGIITRLNSVQLDDCKAQKALLATTDVDDFYKHGISFEKEALVEYAKETGAIDVFEEANKLFDKTGSSTVENISAAIEDPKTKEPITKYDQISECPKPMIDIFFTPGSIINNLTTVRSIGGGYVELIRAMIGDVNISESLDYTYVEPCTEMKPQDLESFYRGDVFKRTLDGDKCEKLGEFTVDEVKYKSINDYVYEQLKGIADTMIAKGDLKPDQEKFIVSIPNAIYKKIKTEIMVRGKDASSEDIAKNLSDVTNACYTYFLLKDLYYLIQDILTTGTTVAKNTKGAKKGSESFRCQLKLKDEPALELGKLKQKTDAYMKAATADYDAHIERYVQFLKAQQDTYEANNKVKADVKNKMKVQLEQ